MFPLSHIHVSVEVARRRSNLLVFGSVLPDISWSSESEIGRDKIHYAPDTMYRFVRAAYPELLDLALGVCLHSDISRGADFYSDGENQSGFAYREGEHLYRGVRSLLAGKNDQVIRVISHNFIEAGVDLNLLSDNDTLLPLYKQSINNIDFNEIVSCMSDYLALDMTIIKQELQRFIEFIGPTTFDTYGSLANRIQELIHVRLDMNVNVDEVQEILISSKKIMSDTYQAYLDKAIQSMRNDFVEYLS